MIQWRENLDTAFNGTGVTLAASRCSLSRAKRSPPCVLSNMRFLCIFSATSTYELASRCHLYVAKWRVHDVVGSILRGFSFFSTSSRTDLTKFQHSVISAFLQQISSTTSGDSAEIFSQIQSFFWDIYCGLVCGFIPCNDWIDVLPALRICVTSSSQCISRIAPPPGGKAQNLIYRCKE